MRIRVHKFIPVLPLTIVLAFGGINTTHTADHGDTPLLLAVERHDARLSDLYAFTRGANLVLILCSRPDVPPDITEYLFPSDLTFRIYIDNDSEVTFDNPQDLEIFGGTIVDPETLREDIIFEITFDEDGRPRFRVEGLEEEKDDVQAQELIDPRRIPHHQELDRVFTGLRDDPFIITVQDGRNVAAIVLELPLAKVLATPPQSTLLIWATSKIPDIVGPFMDLAGRALRSQFPMNDLINTLHPSEHTSKLGIPPDVMIFDTSRPAEFPNGRELTDDVADIVLDAEIPGPENDVPFLDEFPYLAPPHLP